MNFCCAPKAFGMFRNYLATNALNSYHSTVGTRFRLLVCVDSKVCFWRSPCRVLSTVHNANCTRTVFKCSVMKLRGLSSSNTDKLLNRQIYRRQRNVERDPRSHLSVAGEMFLGENYSPEPELSTLTDSEPEYDDMEFISAANLRNVDHAIELEENVLSGDVEEVLDCDQIHAAKQRNKIIQLYGSPDPSVPSSNIPCHGCGAHIHCRDIGIAGYIPSQIFLASTQSQLKGILCQRCHLLSNFNIAVDVSIKPMEFEMIARQIIKTSPALLMVTVDVTDLPNSFFSGFSDLVSSERPIYIIGNKIDLLPRDGYGYLGRIKESIVQMCKDHGVQAQHVALVSAKTGYGIENLITKLLVDWSLKGQVYILGCTNAGKSSLFNALLSSDFCRIAARDVIQRATASVWPGTTLNLLKFPIVNPKPFRLHQRVQRLKHQKIEDERQDKLRREKLIETRQSKYATLMGHIGRTAPTLREAAIEKYLVERHQSGFVSPTYTYSDGSSAADEVDETESDAWLTECIGRNAAVDQMKIKVEPYKDSTFKFWCYDTPGIVNPTQVINHLNTDELMVLVGDSLIYPRTFRLKPSGSAQVLFVSGLGRIDFVKGDFPIYATVFAAGSVPVHAKSHEEADEFYRSNVGSAVLGIPLGDSDRLNSVPSLVGKEISLKGVGWKESAADIILSSLGWVSITTCEENSVTLRAYTPAGLGCTVRSPSLLRYAVNQRGKRIRGTAAYALRPPTFCAEN